MPTRLRPDIVIWSNQLKQVHIVELTCPAEEGMDSAQLRKESKYLPLVEHISSESVWSANLFTIMVSKFIHHYGWSARVHWCFSSQNFPSFWSSQKIVSQLSRNLATIAARCSYAIYLSANSTNWDKDRAFIKVDQ